MHKVSQRIFGNLQVKVFDFPETDDTLPMHNHDEESIHITIVARGAFRLYGDGWEIIAKSGDVIDWEVGKRHEFVALEPNSRCVNILKNVPLGK